MPNDDGVFSLERSAKLFDAAIDRRCSDLDQAFSLIDAGRAETIGRLQKSIAESVEAGKAMPMLEERIKRMMARVDARRDEKIDRLGAAPAPATDLAEPDDPVVKEVIARVLAAADGPPRPPCAAMGLMTGMKEPEAWLEHSSIFGTTGFLSRPQGSEG